MLRTLYRGLLFVGHVFTGGVFRNISVGPVVPPVPKVVFVVGPVVRTFVVPPVVRTFSTERGSC